MHAILRIDHSPIVAIAEFEVADSVYAGADFSLEAVVNIARGLPDGSLPEVVADLSAFGGASASPLTRTGEGEYTLSASLNAGSASGVKTAFIHVKQGDGNTVHEVRYPHTLVVMPSERLEDRVVFDDALSDGWRVQNKAWSESHPYDLNEDAVVFGGERSASFRVFDGDWDWVVRFRPGERFIRPATKACALRST